jgi:16S rRNA processing protein RimM
MSSRQPPPRQRPSRPASLRETAPSFSPAGADEEWVAVGIIVGPFGLRGEVKLLPQTDFPERLTPQRTLYLGPEHRPATIESARPHGPHLLIRFVGVADMTAAAALRGLSVSIPQHEAAPLAQDQYYIHDLIGLAARDLAGADLGIVGDVISGAAQDLLVVRRPGHPDVLVPLVKAIVIQVDLAGGVIALDPPRGLFDDDFIVA